MHRQLLLSAALIAALSGCKSDEARADDWLARAVQSVAAAQASGVTSEKLANLTRAQQILASIQADYPDSRAALHITASQRRGSGDLARIGHLVNETKLDLAQQTCPAQPTALCLQITLSNEEADALGIDRVAHFEKSVSAEKQQFLALLDGGPNATLAFEGQTRNLPDFLLKDLMYQLLQLGHDKALDTWLTQTHPRKESVLTDWEAVLNLAAFDHRGQNWLHTPITNRMAQRLASSSNNSAEHLVTGLGGIDALGVYMVGDPKGKLAEWQQKGWAAPGSATAAMAAVILWNAGEIDAARAIFATMEMAANPFVVGELHKFADRIATSELLLAMLPLTKGSAQRSHIALQLLVHGDTSAAQTGYDTLGTEQGTRNAARRYALPAAAYWGLRNEIGIYEPVLGLARGAFELRTELETGWAIGRAIATNRMAFSDVMDSVGIMGEPWFLREMLWQLYEIGRADVAEQVFAGFFAGDIQGNYGLGGSHLVEAALLAGKFGLAADALIANGADHGIAERALRARLAHHPVSDKLALFQFLKALDSASNGKAAAILAQNDQGTGRGHPELAAEYAMSLTGQQRRLALQNLIEAWPGRAPQD